MGAGRPRHLQRLEIRVHHERAAGRHEIVLHNLLTPALRELICSCPACLMSDCEELTKLLWPPWHTFPAVGTIRSPGDPDIVLYPSPRISSKSNLEFVLQKIEYWREQEIQEQRYTRAIPWNTPSSVVTLSKDEINRCKQNWMEDFMEYESNEHTRKHYYYLMRNRHKKGVGQQIHQHLRSSFNAYLHQTLGAPQVASALLHVGATPQNLRHVLHAWVDHKRSSSYRNAVRKSEQKTRQQIELKAAAHQARLACRRAEMIVRWVDADWNSWWRRSDEDCKLWYAHRAGHLQETRRLANEEFNRSVDQSDSAVGCMLSAMNVPVQW